MSSAAVNKLDFETSIINERTVIIQGPYFISQIQISFVNTCCYTATHVGSWMSGYVQTTTKLTGSIKWCLTDPSSQLSLCYCHLVHISALITAIIMCHNLQKNALRKYINVQTWWWEHSEISLFYIQYHTKNAKFPKCCKVAKTCINYFAKNILLKKYGQTAIYRLHTFKRFYIL